MMIHARRFNLYLIPALVLVCVAGCETAASRQKDAFASLRIHLEAVNEPTNRTTQVQIYRAHPVTIEIQKDSFLNESFVKAAKVDEVRGGFALHIEFEQKGGWLLEQYTAANRNKHLVIFSQFAVPPKFELTEGRWLAAPKISSQLKEGILIFTPDATREEAEQIALGLNNVAKRLATGRDIKW